MPKSFSFPEGFLWGSATSSYQVEGQNNNNDWYLWEIEAKTPFRCGDGVDSYHRFEEDFDLAKSLGHNAHRLSFEWSRIQPEKSRFNDREIEHYKKVISSLRKKSLKPVVTLHHFTNPLWFYRDNCWLNPASADYFAEYVAKVSERFSGLVDCWITVNEPMVYIYNSYIRGLWPPGDKSLNKALRALENIKKAHIRAYDIIHKNCSQASVSVAKHMRVFSPCYRFNFGQNSVPAFLRNRLFNFNILEFFIGKKALDFIGLNYYAKDFVKYSVKFSFGENCKSAHHRLRKNSLNWYMDAKGILKILIKLKRFKMPVMITENGTTEAADFFYEDYLKRHLFYIAKAIESGVNVTGYLWWSLIDNFEWDKGYRAKFGLIEVDKDLNRQIKPFALVYKDICVNNRLEIPNGGL